MREAAAFVSGFLSPWLAPLNLIFQTCVMDSESIKYAKGKIGENEKHE